MVIEKVAVPAETEKGLDSYVSGHFGQAPVFVLSTIKDGKISEIELFSNSVHSGCEGLIQNLVDRGVQVLITQGMGRRPYIMAKQAGIPVIRAVGSTVNEAIENYIKGKTSHVSDEELCSGGGAH
jgi:predicted Fe-Mo cluster-binding NifX family protein